LRAIYYRHVCIANKKYKNQEFSFLRFGLKNREKQRARFLYHDRFVRFIRFAHSVAAIDSLDEQVPREYSIASWRKGKSKKVKGGNQPANRGMRKGLE